MNNSRKIRKYGCLLIFILFLILLSSCEGAKKENQDELIEEMMDSLNVYKNRFDGEGLFLVKVFGCENV